MADVLARVFSDTSDTAVRPGIERHGAGRAAEALHRFSDAGVVEANDGTDAANVAMTAAFARSGYRVIGRCVILR